ncbi:PKD domain-containing protein [Hymenobacter armeniacus]|uniref:PKD domain-containing protein n=1 Tax=Hymenobacter armeniacus TaxID=2771358 RepID=A0ABR8JWP0_9BACT|nr:PKD domain-containing protein [Hymenobacter armeniacus]MBD2722995.1 PKD domain-containing protein [Hymenobacter armeniacus]
MKNIVRAAALGFLLTPMLLASCTKKENQLEGAVPASDFTVTTVTTGLTTVATFRANNTDGFLYQWEFGDGTVGTGQTVSHTYTSGGTLKARLITAYRGGTSVSATKDVVLPQVSAIVKGILTGGSSKTWKLDNTVVAPITVGPSDADPTSYYAGNPMPGQLPACQADDEYTFSTANVFTYDAKGQTFVAGGACDAPRNVTTSFTFGNATGPGLAQLTLASATPSPFIGVTDAPGFTYRILSIDSQHMLVRAGSTAAGVVFDMKFIAK